MKLRNDPEVTPLASMKPAEPRPGPAAPPRVLVVEDEAAVRLLVVMHLADSGFSVVEAASADEAVTILQHDGFVTLVFSDIQMPGAEDGVALAHWIRRERPHVKVLLTSGRPIPTAAGAWPSIAKPYRLQKVEQQLRDMASA